MKRSTPLKRTGRLRPMSAKRQRAAREYARKRKAFLAAHPFCQVWLEEHNYDEAACLAAHRSMPLGSWNLVFARRGLVAIRVRHIPQSVDIHHKAGRTGANYLDESTWMAVSREAHDWIHAHPKEARARGWLA